MFYRQWNEKMLEEAYSALMEDLPLDPSAPGGMIQYRRSLSLRYSIISTEWAFLDIVCKIQTCHSITQQFILYTIKIIYCQGDMF